MTTNVIGTKWSSEGSHVIEVKDSLDYRRGWSWAYGWYSLDPRIRGRVTATDGPESSILTWEGNIKVTVDGKHKDPSMTNYDLKEGHTVVARGPESKKIRAEVTITFTPVGSRERSF